MRRTSKQLSSLHGVEHGFFGRSGGVSEGIYASLNCGAGSDDAASNVAENKHRITQELGAQQLCSLHQVHSADVVTVNAVFADKPKADAMVTNQPGIALGILTADCGPVLFADAQAGVIGAAHAGWKGAHGGVLENTVTAMEALGASRSNITAALGPTISQASYEVGEAFRANIVAEDETLHRFFTDDHYFNLPAYICHRLTRLGLARVEDLAIDTYANKQDYFSYRRKTHLDEPDYGRQISAIMIKE